MIDPEEAAAFKAYVIERSRDPAEGLSARERALMACIVIPPEIQKWMIDAGALEPLLDSIGKNNSGCRARRPFRRRSTRGRGA